MMNPPKKDEFGFSIEETDLDLLESLIKSPVFSALKRAVSRYQESCYSVLTTSKDAPKLFETQGRIIGSNVLVKLPELLVTQRRQKNEAKSQRERAQKQFIKKT